MKGVVVVKEKLGQLDQKVRQFMIGRYGADQFSKALLYAGLVCVILGLIFKSRLLNILALAFIIYTYYRIFSKNHAKRYQENAKYLQYSNLVNNKINREKRLMAERKVNHIYTCPQCKQKLRMPKGKGKVIITCPKCHTEFKKKS